MCDKKIIYQDDDPPNVADVVCSSGIDLAIPKSKPS